MMICGILFAACTTTPQPRPYTLTTQAAQTGPQHILLGQGIDINSADSVALESLPGIGSGLAERIVEYRTANGPFASIQSLRNVSGIGEKTLQRLGLLIQVSSKH